MFGCPRLRLNRWLLAGIVTIVASVSTAVSATRPVIQGERVLNFVGVTAHVWGTWVQPGVTVDEWVDEARAFCVADEGCQVNVFEGPRLATHEHPVPTRNRSALRWVFHYRLGESPAIVIEETSTTPGQDPRRWTVDR